MRDLESGVATTHAIADNVRSAPLRTRVKRTAEQARSGEEPGLARASHGTGLAWFLSGVAWAVRSLLQLAGPDYYDPVTLPDWLAVASYTIAWLLSAIAVVLLARDVGARTSTLLAWIFWLAASVAGLANAAEDALDVSWTATPYLVGFFVGWLTLPALAVAFWRAGARRIALLPAALFASIALFTVGGGLIVAVVAVAFALAPARFRPVASATTRGIV